MAGSRKAAQDDRLDPTQDIPAPLPRTTRRRLLAGGAVAGGMLLGAISRESARARPANQESDRARTLIIGRNLDDITTLDPHRALDITYVLFDRLAYDTLITFRGDNFGEPQSVLAESWEVAPDGSTLTFTLREGLVFASGNPVTADDVKFSIERLKNLKGNPAFLADPVQEIAVLDPRTVEITLADPDFSFLASLAAPPFAIMDQKLAEEHGASAAPDADQTDTAEAWLNENTAGSGGWVLAEYQAKDRLIYARNENAWIEVPFDEVRILSVPEPATQMFQLQQGDIDIALDLDPDQIAEVSGSPGVAISSTSSLAVFYIAVNQDPAITPVAGKQQFVRAMQHALDYDGLTALVPGAVHPATIVPSALPGALPLSEAPQRDLEQARALLAEAGFANGVTVTLSTVNTVAYAGTSPSVLAEKIQADLAEVGIEIELEIQETQVYLEGWRGKQKQMAIPWYFPDYAETSNFLRVFVPGGLIPEARLSWTTDTDIAEALDAAVRNPDIDARNQAYQDIQRELIARGPYVSLVEPQLSVAYRDDLENVEAEALYFISPAYITRAG